MKGTDCTPAQLAHAEEFLAARANTRPSAGQPLALRWADACRALAWYGALRFIAGRDHIGGTLEEPAPLDTTRPAAAAAFLPAWAALLSDAHASELGARVDRAMASALAFSCTDLELLELREMTRVAMTDPELTRGMVQAFLDNIDAAREALGREIRSS